MGAGASWLDVYKYLDPYGVTVAGGRNGAVGVGGLTLGGGISYFAPRVGWTCDTVSNFEVSLHLLLQFSSFGIAYTARLFLRRDIWLMSMRVLTQISFELSREEEIILE